MARIKSENTMVKVQQPRLDMERADVGVAEILAAKDKATGQSAVGAVLEYFSPKGDPNQDLKSVMNTMNQRIDAGVQAMKRGEIDPVAFNDRINQLMIDSLAHSRVDPKNWEKVKSFVAQRMRPLTSTNIIKQEGVQYVVDSFGNTVRQFEPDMEPAERFYEAIVGAYPQYGQAMVAELADMDDPTERMLRAKTLVRQAAKMGEKKFGYDMRKLNHEDAELEAAYDQEQADREIRLSTAETLQELMDDTIFDKEGNTTLSPSNWSTRYNTFKRLANEWMTGSHVQQLSADAGLNFGEFESKVNTRVKEMESIFKAMSGADRLSLAYEEQSTKLKLRVALLKGNLNDQDLLNAEEPRLLEALAFGEIHKEMISNDAAEALRISRSAVQKSDSLEELIDDQNYEQILGYAEDQLAAAAEGGNVNLYSLQQYYDEVVTNTELFGQLSEKDSQRIRRVKQLYKALINGDPRFRQAMTIRKRQLKDITDTFFATDNAGKTE